MRFSVGQELEGLEFIEVLRSNDQSVAYKVRDTITRRLEYLKLVPASLNGDTDALNRFLREARVHASLDHPNIARFYSARRIDGELVMTREWVDGESLTRKLAAGPLPLAQSIDYVSQALGALAYAHAQGVVHRDVTADNLLVTEQGVVKLTGFDLARTASDPRLTRTGVTIGSVHYMSPEQVQGSAELDPRSDLYSLGIVLYQAITGVLPFECENHFDVLVAHVEKDEQPPSKTNPDVPEAMDDIVRKALRKNPGDRYQTAGDFLNDLKAALDVVCSSGTPRPAAQPPPPLQPSIPVPVTEAPAPVEVLAPSPVLSHDPALSPEPALAPDRALAPGPMLAPEVPLPPPAPRDSVDTLKMVGLAVIGFTLGIALFVLGLQITN